MTLLAKFLLRAGYVRLSDLGLRRLKDGSLVAISEPSSDMSLRLADPTMFNSGPASYELLDDPATLLELPTKRPAPKTPHHEILVSLLPAESTPSEAPTQRDAASQDISSQVETQPVACDLAEPEAPFGLSAKATDDEAASVVDHEFKTIDESHQRGPSNHDWDAIISKARENQELLESDSSQDGEQDWDTLLQKAKGAAA